MASRIIREGILSSNRVNQLDWDEEVFYRRLMSLVDDYGRYDGRNSILRAFLYPLKLNQVSDADVGKWKRANADAGLVSLYEVEGREYVQVERFNQRIKPGTASKWPAPPPIRRIPESPGSSGKVPDNPAQGVVVVGGGGEGESGGAGAGGPALPGKSLSFIPTSRADVESILAAYPFKKELWGASDDVGYALAEMRQMGIAEPVVFLRERIETFAESDEGKTCTKVAHWWFYNHRWKEPDAAWANKVPKKKPNYPPGFEPKTTISPEVAALLKEEPK